MTSTAGIELVLLPGLDGTGELFERLQQRLPDDFTITALRYPADPSLTYDDYVTLVRDAIGSRRVVVLGESFSGPIAVKIAAALPEQVAGVVLAATFLKSPWPPFLVRRAAAVNPHRAPRKARDAFLMGRYGDAALSAKLDDLIRRLTPGLRARRLKEVAGVDVRDQFHRLTCPVLAMHGSEDWVVPPRQMKAVVKSKPGARLVLFPAAHMLLQTRATEAAGAITSFVRDLTGQT